MLLSERRVEHGDLEDEREGTSSVGGDVGGSEREGGLAEGE
jgi:hypothetical protein